MNPQLQMTFSPVHRRENNPESLQHLELHRDKFTKQCWKLLKRLLAGERLTVLHAANTGISSLPRRAKDLRDGFGIPVKREWALDGDGNKLDYKEYYIESADIPKVMLRLVDKLELITEK